MHFLQGNLNKASNLIYKARVKASILAKEKCIILINSSMGSCKNRHIYKIFRVTDRNKGTNIMDHLWGSNQYLVFLTECL